MTRAGGRVPPGQYITHKFPVMSYGKTPTIDKATWTFLIHGLVNTPVTLTLQEFLRLPKIKVVADLHCVTQWSRLNNHWEGVSFRELLKLANPSPEAKFVMLHCNGDYTTNIPIWALMDENVLFAHQHDGKDLELEHGGPLRLVVPKLYGWKSAKWVRSLEFMDKDRPGFWEARGYNTTADPWKEERFRDQ